jgi:hypothetical protein
MGVTPATMAALGVVRPDEWNLPLFVHLLGALTLTGAVFLTALYLFSAWRSSSAETLRLAQRSLLIGVLPAWIVLRGSAEWIGSEQGIFDIDPQPDWVTVGYIATDVGMLVIIVSGLLGWTALRRARRDGPRQSARVRVAACFITLLLIANLVAIWAMTTKPA